VTHFNDAFIEDRKRGHFWGSENRGGSLSSAADRSIPLSLSLRTQSRNRHRVTPRGWAVLRGHRVLRLGTEPDTTHPLASKLLKGCSICKPVRQHSASTFT